MDKDIILAVGIVAVAIGYLVVGIIWACAYEQECGVGDKFEGGPAVGLWPLMLLWMLLYGTFRAINKWYRWASRR